MTEHQLSLVLSEIQIAATDWLVTALNRQGITLQPATKEYLESERARLRKLEASFKARCEAEKIAPAMEQASLFGEVPEWMN